ncbi:MAG: hypothetical protein JXR88_00935 [Clostridia bacterium]|nr:hypothetical protein [Clostridia bacterium]
MNWFKKKHGSRNIAIHQVFNLNGDVFVIEDLHIEGDEIKLNIFFDGHHTLMFEEDLEELWLPYIEYIGFKDADLFINGKKLIKKKVYQRSSQPRSSYLTQLYEDAVVDWENIGRQTLTFAWEEACKDIESIQLVQEEHHVLIKTKVLMEQLNIGKALNVKVPYTYQGHSHEVILRKLATRPIQLHPEVQKEMEKRRLQEDLEVLKDMENYHHMIMYFEVPQEVEELLISIKTPFEQSHGSYTGFHTYETLNLFHCENKIVIKALGMIPKTLKTIDLRLGYVKITKGERRLEFMS